MADDDDDDRTSEDVLGWQRLAQAARAVQPPPARRALILERLFGRGTSLDPLSTEDRAAVEQVVAALERGGSDTPSAEELAAYQRALDAAYAACTQWATRQPHASMPPPPTDLVEDMRPHDDVQASACHVPLAADVDAAAPLGRRVAALLDTPVSWDAGRERRARLLKELRAGLPRLAVGTSPAQLLELGREAVVARAPPDRASDDIPELVRRVVAFYDRELLGGEVARMRAKLTVRRGADAEHRHLAMFYSSRLGTVGEPHEIVTASVAPFWAEYCSHVESTAAWARSPHAKYVLPECSDLVAFLVWTAEHEFAHVLTKHWRVAQGVLYRHAAHSRTFFEVLHALTGRLWEYEQAARDLGPRTLQLLRAEWAQRGGAHDVARRKRVQESVAADIATLLPPVPLADPFASEFTRRVLAAAEALDATPPVDEDDLVSAWSEDAAKARAKRRAAGEAL